MLKFAEESRTNLPNQNSQVENLYEITFQSVLRVRAPDKKTAIEIAYTVIQKTPNVVSPFPIAVLPITEDGNEVDWSN
jgi:hypothetical protein